jgi:dihydroorotate dehydrogenase (NAD+) catalytic subunit
MFGAARRDRVAKVEHQVSDTDCAVRVGSVELRSPIMTASGTAGYGDELAAYLDLASIGAVVTKSIAAFEWPGNPPPRIHATPLGMINAVGLQGPGIEAWLGHHLPALEKHGATVVCSIWGRSVDDYRTAADMLAGAPAGVVAVEVNLSCPNTEGPKTERNVRMFAHDPGLAAEAIAATAGCNRPRWAKLSANTDRLVDVAAASADAGAEAVTLINTMLGMVLDEASLRPALGNGGGGISGRAIHPIAVRAVHDVREALPELPIVGVGGVACGWDAAELMLAGAQAVQIGTATFADPRACARVHAELVTWARVRGVARLEQLNRVLWPHGNTSSVDS